MKKQGVGPGSHNRDTKKAIQILESSKNLTKECKCILHLKELGKGTIISKTRFNRQSSSKDGVQYMCSTGKTLIDAIKHKFWRSISLLLLSSVKEQSLIQDTKEFNWFIDIDFFKKYQLINQLNNIFENEIIKEFNLGNINQNMNSDLYFKASAFLENKLTLDNLGFYTFISESEELALINYNLLLKDLEDFTEVEKLNYFKETLYDLVGNDLSHDFYTLESADKKTYYPIDSVSINWSKMNNLYEFKDGEYIKTENRGPFHNTKAIVNGTTSRTIKFLVEVHKDEGFKETNSYIKLIKKPDHDADHIWPLALGGKHTKTNIASLPSKTNLLKKDHITYTAYMLLFDDLTQLNKMVSKEFVSVILDFVEIVEKDEILFNQNVNDFEKKLKSKMEERQNKFKDMTQDEKTTYLNKIRPDLNDKNILKFIERFERHKGKK